MKLVFATNNKHKFDEVASKVEANIELISLKNLNINEEIPETKNTLEGNATQKAMYIYENFGYNCFSDDTGLEIDALNGQPGVYSARYAGPDCTFEDNVNKVLKEMSGIINRKARFRTVVAFVLKGEVHLFEGIVNGEIMTFTKGDKGFGYDPIFKPEGYNLTFAEMSLNQKNEISHRGIAINKFIHFLTTL